MRENFELDRQKEDMRWLVRLLKGLPDQPADAVPRPARVEPRLLRSTRMFELSPKLRASLSSHREGRGHDAITKEHDAFLLDPGVGPATYLTSDGRVFWNDDGWGVKGTRADALASVFAGIQKMLAKAGCTDVRTYVQSGNAVFGTKLGEAARLSGSPV